MNLTNSWMTDPAFLAQSAHFFGATSAIMASSYFFGKRGAIISAIIFLVVAGFKEFWYDLVFELPKQTFGDSALDFSFYLLGVVVSVLLVMTIKPSIN
jgi:hypothetical protein